MRLTTSVCVWLAIAHAALADGFSGDVTALSSDHAAGAPPGSGVVTQTCQGHDNELLIPGSVACSPDGGQTVAENGHARQWAAVGRTALTDVRFGIESCRDVTGAGRPCPIEVRAYSAPSFPRFDDATLLAAADIDIPDGTLLEIFEVDFHTVPIPHGTNLVIEVYNPDSFRSQFGFWPGANDAGQIAPSYIRSAPCGLADWGDLANIGFPHQHNVICWNRGDPGQCVYVLKKDAKPRKGCGACPERGDRYGHWRLCQTVQDCARKIRIKQMDCPDGGAGFCRRIKGKREGCW